MKYLRGAGRFFAFACLMLPMLGARAQSTQYQPYNLRDTVKLDGVTLFAADDGVHGVELWRSDGTDAGTYMLAEINVGAAGSYPAYFVRMNGLAYFSADDGVRGAELWSTDGTAQNTYIVADINPGPKGAHPYFLTNVAGTLYFQANDGVHGPELWATDGTSAHTALVGDINPGPAGSYPTYLTAYQPATGPMVLLFAADDGLHGRQLWEAVMPAPSGLFVPKQIDPTGSSFPTELTQVGDRVFFSATDAVTGRELWSTDGTPDGTVQVLDINPGAAESSPRYFAGMNGIVYFSAHDEAHGTQLWRSDGTPAGTYMVANLFADSGGPFPTQLGVQGDRLYFTAQDPVLGPQPWVTDGTDAGTVPLSSATGTALVSWAPVTQNDDGTPLTNLSGYRVYYGNSPDNLDNVVQVDDFTMTSRQIGSLLPGTVYFAVTAFNTDGVESVQSAIVSKQIPSLR
jgi:ELWxxDGT repeat protein